MIPYLLAAVGGYLIGQSRKSDKLFDDGGTVDENYRNTGFYLYPKTYSLSGQPNPEIFGYFENMYDFKKWVEANVDTEGIDIDSEYSMIFFDGDKDAIEEFVTNMIAEASKKKPGSSEMIMAHGGKVPANELKEFKEYVFEFYGNDGMYEEFFPPLGVSKPEIDMAVKEYVEYATKEDKWGNGDSFDREIVRDLMFYNRGQKRNLEYQKFIKEIVKSRE